MGGMGRPPKPAHLRQRKNVKAGSATIEAPENPEVPPIPNPDAREWQPLTLASWKTAWRSAMASQWVQTDVDGMGRLAIAWDEYYKHPTVAWLAELRLQEQRFGLSPLDRSRLQWEIGRTDQAERNPDKPVRQPSKPRTDDPRAILLAVK